MVRYTVTAREDRAPLWRWQHILSLLAFLAAIFGLYLGYLAKERAYLELTPLAEAVLAERADDPDIELRFKGELVRRASLVFFSVRNSGNVDLQRLRDDRPTDPRNPRFRIILPGSKILDVRTDPQSQGAGTTLEPAPTGLSHILDYGIVVMNAGATVRFTAIVADYDPGLAPLFEVSGVGVRGRVMPTGSIRSTIAWWQFMIVLTSGLIAVRLTRPLTGKLATAAESRVGWISLVGGTAYAFIWDFTITHPNRSQRSQGLQWITSSLLFLIVSAVGWRLARMLAAGVDLG